MTAYLLYPKLDKRIRSMLAFATEDLAHHSPMTVYALPQYFSEEESDEILEYARQQALLKACKFYKGEKENPYPLDDIKHTYWFLESAWVENVNDNEILRGEYALNMYLDLGADLGGIKGIPIYLLATMYDQYTHFGGSKEGFKDFALAYLYAKDQPLKK